MGRMPHETDPVILRGARIWDGTAERPTRTPEPVVVEGGRIAEVGPPAAPRLDGRDHVIDLDGLFLMPGLIDAHVHMELDPTIGSPADQFAVAETDRRLRMIARARAMADAGITTARDLGGGQYMELDLRDGIASGEVAGPRLVCAGQPLTLPEGHCHFWGGGAATADAQREVIARQLERGVDWVKVMATGGVFTKGSSVRDAQFGAAEIAAAVTQSAEAGRRVAAHCHGTTGIRHAARGGVATIEHCSFAGDQGFGSDLDAETVAEIARAGSVVSPTMNLGWGRRLTDEHGRPSAFFARMSKVVRALRDAGVPLVASSDAGIPGVAHHRFAEGLLAFQRYAAFAPVELLKTATSGAAAGLGLEVETGNVAPGLAADLIAVRDDPTLDPATLLDPVFVMTRGRVVRHDERSTATNSSR